MKKLIKRLALVAIGVAVGRALKKNESNSLIDEEFVKKASLEEIKMNEIDTSSLTPGPFQVLSKHQI